LAGLLLSQCLYRKAAGFAATQAIGPLGNPISVDVLVPAPLFDLLLPSDAHGAGVIPAGWTSGPIGDREWFEFAFRLVAKRLSGAERGPFPPELCITKILLDPPVAALDADLPAAA
jgi:hypothetical protein